MTRKKRSGFNPFNLAFLDIMFCGFGAVLLLVLILNHDTFDSRERSLAELNAELEQLQQQVQQETVKQAAIKNQIHDSEQQRLGAERKIKRMIAESQLKKDQIKLFEQQTQASIDHIKQLQADLLKLDQQSQASRAQPSEQGRHVRQFYGHGDRQYLTGMKLNGNRTLILIDNSASMLDQRIVNIIRLRNMDDNTKRRAHKWQRAVAAVEWVIANLPPNSQYQIYSFNTEAKPLINHAANQWLSTTDTNTMNEAILQLKQRVPASGTSLAKAFLTAVKLKPRPDNIILITDGLPTQGSNPPSGSTVSAEQRLLHFTTAVQQVLPKGIPVNIFLFPMEGDAYAAAAFWQLAMRTQGSFITPTKDWP